MKRARHSPNKKPNHPARKLPDTRTGVLIARIRSARPGVLATDSSVIIPCLLRRRLEPLEKLELLDLANLDGLDLPVSIDSRELHRGEGVRANGVVVHIHP
jgi:hypothetical protein